MFVDYFEYLQICKYLFIYTFFFCVSPEKMANNFFLSIITEFKFFLIKKIKLHKYQITKLCVNVHCFHDEILLHL